MTRYPKSGLFYDAKFMLGGAYRETGSLSNAVLAMSDVLKYADKQLLVNRASSSWAMIQEQQGDKTGRAGLLPARGAAGGPEQPGRSARWWRRACWRASTLGMELKRYQDVLDSCDQYLKLFPTGEKIEEVRKAKADAKLKATPKAAAAAGAGPAAQRRRNSRRVHVTMNGDQRHEQLI